MCIHSRKTFLLIFYFKVNTQGNRFHYGTSVPTLFLLVPPPTLPLLGAAVGITGPGKEGNGGQRTRPWPHLKHERSFVYPSAAYVLFSWHVPLVLPGEQEQTAAACPPSSEFLLLRFPENSSF